MTKTPEVLAVMEATTPFTKPNGFIVSRLNAALLFTAFVVCLVGTALIAYSFAPCHEQTPSVLSTDTSASVAENETKPAKINVRLPRSVVPHSYKIELVPFIWENNFTFNGEVMIIVNVTEATNNITLHVHDIKVTETNLSKINDLENDGIIEESQMVIERTSTDEEKQFFIIHSAESLEVGMQYKVGIKYIGNLNDVLQGFYRSSYVVNNTKRWIATSQFQSTDARRAFPCFDEPALKARFTISIGRPENMTAVSNMPKKSGPPEPVIGVPGYVWDHFEESVPMSTYLVAFTVSDFKQLSDSSFFSVWAREEALQQARYSLDIGPKILKHYEKYFQIKFPLPKIDMIALPDFAAGAMENWGLITYRETAMLYQQGISTIRDKQRVATVVGHELAHQWFGNLVTPSWWTDLWLNEGFATYVECLGVDAVEPEWKIIEQFVVDDLQNVFLLDVYKSSHPISVEVNHPNEIDEIFDSISYEKGASIIRMMDHFLTTPVFKRGLTKYLNSKAYQCATQDDLWQALTDQAHEDQVLDGDMTVKDIMYTWTLQTGFPLVTVTRNYDNNSAFVTQVRFMLGNNTDTNNSLWWVPLTYTSQDKLDFENTHPMHWLKAEPSIELPDLKVTPNHWVLFNIKQTGFYRVNYDANNWKLIIKQLMDPQRFQQIGTVNRAQLVDDALNLARAGVLNYSMALDVTRYLQQELEYLPWKAGFTGFNYIFGMISKTGGFDKFKAYLLNLLKNLYEDTGFVDNMSDNQLRVYKRVEVLKWACLLGHEDCVRNAITQFQNWRSSPQPDRNNPISPNLKSTVYCTALRVGGQAEWDFAWQRYIKTNVGSEKSLLLQAMGCSRETWILSRYLDRAVSYNSGIRKQDAAAVFAAVSNNVIGQPLAFAFIRDQWKRVKEYFGGTLFTINNIIQVSTNKMTTEFELETLKEFARVRKPELAGARKVVKQQIEKTEENVAWMKANYDHVIRWLSNITVSS